MAYIMVDIESEGPIPGDFSMISFGAVIVDEQLDKTFYGRLKPISDKFVPEALAVTGHSREETLKFEEPKEVMTDFANLISLYKGIEKGTFKTFKHLRKTKHTHNPVDDAKGNSEALLTMKTEYRLKIKF